MVTPDEIGLVPLFAQLDAAQRERLSRAAADISLAAGEYAAPQGSEPALFAVLDGRIEPVQLAEGVERVVGTRDPGEIFGEVPITLGTVFPVGFRAAVPSRVMRIEPRDYHAVASGSPDVAKEVGRLASHRMSGLRGLQGLAADPPPPRAIVVGHRLDPACSELRRFLARNQVTFDWLSPDTPAQDGALGRPAAGRGRHAHGPRDRGQDRDPAAAAPRRRAARARHRARARRVRRGDRRRRARRARGGGLRRLGGPAHARRRARGAGRPGRHVVADRQLPRLPRRGLRRRAREPGAAAGAPARGGDPRDPLDPADRPGHAPGPPRRRRRAARADDHPRLRGLLAPAPARRLRAPRGPRRVLRRVAQRGGEHPWRGRPHRRRGQLGRARRRCSSPRTRAA